MPTDRRNGKDEKMALFQKQATEKTLNRVVELPTTAIAANPAQPRVIFDDYELSQLAVSIKQNGILQPLTVRRRDKLTYELIAGERRLRAAKLVGIDSVPCIIIDATTENSAVLAILENIQRSDLNYMEEAYAIKNLIEYYGITQENAAAKLGVAQSTIANKLRLLKLTEEEKAAVLRYHLTERQARALLKLPDGTRLAAVEKIAAAQMNTAQTDRFIEELLSSKPKQKKHSWAFRAVSLYVNTINHTIDSMKQAGIKCEASRNKTDDFIEYFVKIPLR